MPLRRRSRWPSTGLALRHAIAWASLPLAKPWTPRWAERFKGQAACREKIARSADQKNRRAAPNTSWADRAAILHRSICFEPPSSLAREAVNLHRVDATNGETVMAHRFARHRRPSHVDRAKRPLFPSASVCGVYNRDRTMPSPLTSPRGGSVAMGNCADLGLGIGRPDGFALLFSVLPRSFPCLSAASAQDTAIMTRGDAAVTAFSGARQIGEVPPDLHPLDLTFIDVNGATLQVFDLTELGGAPDGPGRRCAGQVQGDGRRDRSGVRRGARRRHRQCDAEYLRHLDLAVRLADRHPPTATAWSRASLARAGCPASSASTKAARPARSGRSTA